MDKSQGILDKINRKDGLTVPDGYFADFAERMKAQLPERPELERPVVAPKSMWKRVKPYVYMAAMFAGVWCMIKMFTLMGTPVQDVSIENLPDLANAVSNEQFVEDYVIDDISGYDFVDQMVSDSIEFLEPDSPFELEDLDEPGSESENQPILP